jgi:hypothetical protein
MKVSFLAAVLGLSLAAGASQAQISVYFTGGGARVSNSVADSGPFAFLGQNQKSQIFGGVTLGGQYDFYHAEKFDAGADVRYVIEHGNSAELNSFLVGPRITHHFNRWSPYAEIAVGEVRTRSPLSPVHLNRLEADVFVGADYRLGKHVDARVLEIGYGEGTTISSSNYSGGTVSIPAARLLRFTSGFVFHF